MTKFFQKLLTISMVLSASYGAQAGGPDSGIFDHEDKDNAKNLSVRLRGTTSTGAFWEARNLTPDDVPFMEDLFADDVVMKGFAGGATRERAATRKRMETMWLPRFQEGQPHGGLVVVDPEGGTRMGHIVAGGGDEAGVSEIAYSYMSDFWNQKLGVSVLTEVVETWAPTVRRVGLGVDPVHNSKNAITAFRCFGGANNSQEEKILRRLDATASPKNPGSWMILDKTGFNAAQYKLDKETVALNFKGIELPTQEVDEKIYTNYKPLEEKLFPLFDVRIQGHRNLELRYSLFDDKGKDRTFSLKFDVVKYHFEKPVF